MEDTTKFISLLLLVFPLSTEANHGVTGTPPRFIQEPEDMVVYATNADGSRASLTLYCNASGSPTPIITWYRSGMTFNNARTTVNANGTLVIVNITQGTDARPEGLPYYCTARNKFGTIRSRTANISYAYFNGFTGPSGTVMVNVATGIQAAVAVECRVGDANPPPIIQWRDANGPLTEITASNRLRFLHNGRYLLINQLTTAQTNTNYHCEVTNVRLHDTVRSPTTYDLVDNVGANEFMIYKRFVNRTVLVGDSFELSYIVGAGRNVTPFGFFTCQRSGNTLDSDISPLTLPHIGGVISEPIPDTPAGEQIPAAAASVTFAVRCSFVTGQQITVIQTTLTVQAPPQIVAPLPQDKLEEFAGDMITFTCNVAGIPTPAVTWYLNGVQLNSSGVISISGNTLTISSMAVAHTGMYQCFSSNPVGSVQHSWALQVRVADAPAVTRSSFNVLTVDSGVNKRLLVAPIVGGQVTLFAVVTADPCPPPNMVQWRMNGSVVSNGGNYMIGNPCSNALAGTTSFNFTLRITANSATTGSYTATITNRAGSANVREVFVTPPVPVIISQLRISSSANCLLSGTSVDIQCVNSGFPRPEIVFFQGTQRITTGEGSRFTQVSFDTVRLRQAQQTDNGQYVCEARDGNIQLNRSQPRDLVFCTQPEIVSLPAPTTHTEGERFELICTFTGIPNPEIRWEKDGSVFLLGEGRRIINSTGGTTKTSQLEISTLLRSDAGVYTCSVTNVANRAMSNGMDLRSVRLEVRAMSPPTSVPPPTSMPPPTSLPGLSPGVIAGIVVGTTVGLVLIVGFLLLVFFCGIIVAARFLKRDSPPAPPGTTEISLTNNVAYERCNHDKDQDHQYEKLNEYQP